MKIEYNNLYTHFVFTTSNRQPIILEKFRDRIEKYITGIVNNNACKMYSIYAKRSIDNLCEYIKNQKEHHKKQSYTEEYGQFVKFYQQTIHKTNIIR